VEIHRGNGGGTIPADGSTDASPETQAKGSVPSILSTGGFVGEPPSRGDQERAGAQPLAPVAVIAGDGGRSWIAVQANSEDLPRSHREEKVSAEPARTRNRPSAGPRKRSEPVGIRDLVPPELLEEPEPGPAPVRSEAPAEQRSVSDCEEPVRVAEPETGGQTVRERVANVARALDASRVPLQMFRELTGLEVEPHDERSSIVSSQDRFFRTNINGERERVHPSTAFHIYAKAVAEQPRSPDLPPPVVAAPLDRQKKPGFFERREMRARERSANLIRAAGPTWAAFDMQRLAGAEGNLFLAIGPGGIYAISFHEHRGTVAVGGEVVQVAGRRYPYLTDIRERARFMSEALTRSARLEKPIPVHPILAFTGRSEIMRLGRDSDVIAIRADDLPELLHGTGQRIADETVQKLHRLAEHPFTWK
jgi:hypothetical protein